MTYRFNPFTGNLDASGPAAGLATTIRHEFAPPYDYVGKAPAGSLESAEVWTITRIEISGDGTTDTKSATDVAWADRAVATYA
jgi:hypothetical protein